MIFFLFAAAGAMFMVLHLMCMAVCARALGIGVKTIAFGMGPAWFERGKLRLGVLPLGGYVKLKLAEEGDLEAAGPGACFDTQPRWKRVFLPLSGVGGALLAASVVLGGGALDSFLLGFGQLVRGALHPLSAGDASLSAFAQAAAVRPSAVVLALLWCKLAACNLLPCAGSNGAQALLSALAPAGQERRWEGAVSPLLLLCTFVLLGGWVIALGAHFVRS